LATWECGALLAGFPGLVSAAYPWNMQAPASKDAQDVFDLHMLMMGIIVVIFVAVFAVMFYSVFAHRRSKGQQAVQFHEHSTVELLWTIIPLIILILMAWPAAKVLLSLRDTSSPDVTIKVTAYQWKWGYDYVSGEGEGIRFVSALATSLDQTQGTAPKGENDLLEVDNPVVVPVGKKIRILTTGSDVIHSWWVPALGIKQDASPGIVRDTWFRADKEGTFRGQCPEPCGKNHDFMPVVVEVVSAGKYTTWVGDQKRMIAARADDPGKIRTLDELKARGEKVYAANCLACHQANGQGVAGTYPALDGSKIASGLKDGQISIVMNGKQGTAMAAFGKQLSDTEIAAVITYTRNGWGNKSGDVIQPAEIKSLRN